MPKLPNQKCKTKTFECGKIERKVFTRWINYQLHSTKKSVSDLKKDLADGLILICLVETLSGKQIKNVNKSNLRQHRVENVNLALSALAEEEICVQNIDSSSIVDGHCDMIMNLVWKLILHYSISLPLGDENNEGECTAQGFLTWLNSKINGFVLTNFSSDWNSGVAIGVLVNSVDEELCIDVHNWEISNSIKNASFSIEAAFQCFHIQKWVRPAEIVDKQVTERSIMTYVSQFIEPLKYRFNLINDVTGKGMSSMEEDGGYTSEILDTLSIDEKNKEEESDYNIEIKEKDCLHTNRKIHFLIFIQHPEERGNIFMEAKDPNDITIPLNVNVDYQGPEMEFSLYSSLPGLYKLFVCKKMLHNESKILKTFHVELTEEGHGEKTYVFGPGLLNATIGHRGSFILLMDNSKKEIGFSMEGPSKAEIDCIDLGDSIINVTYTASIEGIYELSILSNNVEICGSPHLISVIRRDNLCDFQNILTIGLIEQDINSFTIDARLTNVKGLPNIQLFNNVGSIVQGVKIEEQEEQLFRCRIEYPEDGRYIIFASFFEVQLQGFPHVVNTNSKKDTSLDNPDNEISGSVLMQEKCLEVLHEKLAGSLEISVHQLSEESQKDSISESFSNVSGDSQIMTVVDQVEKVLEKQYQWKDKKLGLTIMGSSLNGDSIKSNTLQMVVIDMNNTSCKGEIGVSIEGPCNTNLQCHDNGKGRCVIEYYPSKPGSYKFNLSYNNEPIFGSPFNLEVLENTELHQSSHLQNECSFSDIIGRLAHSSELYEDPSFHKTSSGNFDIVDNKSLTQKSEKEDTHLSMSLPEFQNINSRFKEHDEFRSNSSSESLHSILSGIYVAKIRRARSENFVKIPTQKRTYMDPASTSSSYVEIDHISVNYKECLNNFYENMLSAFTNLIALEILFTTMDRITELVQNFPNKTQRIQHTSDITSFSESLRTPLTHSAGHHEYIKSLVSSYSVPITVEYKDLSTAADLSTLPLNNDYINSNFLDSKPDLKNNKTMFDVTNEGSQVTFSVMKSHKSIPVDIGSSYSPCTSNTVRQGQTKTTADVIFDSISKTYSSEMSRLISVYGEHSAPNLQEPHLEDIRVLESSLNDKHISKKESLSGPIITCFQNYTKKDLDFLLNHDDSIENTSVNFHRVTEPERLRSKRPGHWKRYLKVTKRHNISTSNRYNHNVIDLSQSDPYCKPSQLDNRMQEHRISLVNLVEEYAEWLTNINSLERNIQFNTCSSFTMDQTVVKVFVINPLDCQRRSENFSACNKDCQTNMAFLEEIDVYEVLILETINRCIYFLVSNELKIFDNNVSKDSMEDGPVRQFDREVQATQIPFVPVTSKENEGKKQYDGGDGYRSSTLESFQYHHYSLGQSKIEDNRLICSYTAPTSSSNDIKDISYAVETLVDAITNIAKGHIILHPSKNNIKRVEELIALLPRLITFGKEKKLIQINYLTDRLETILVHNNNQTRNNKAINQIIRSIKNCIDMDKDEVTIRNEANEKYKETEPLAALRTTENDVMEHINLSTAGNHVIDIEEEVLAVGAALKYGRTNSENKFVVYTKHTIPGSLSICIEGPSKAKINIVDKQVGIYIVCYEVGLPGEYTCVITYNLNSIPNSPFKIKVLSDLSSIKNDKLEDKIDSVQANEMSRYVMLPVNRNIVFHLRNVLNSTLSCFITGPSGVCGYLPIETKPKEGLISFFTTNIGVYNLEFFNSFGEKVGKSWILNVTNMRSDICSSTVHYNVDIYNKPPKIKPNIVAYGEGLSSGKINTKNSFHLIVRHEYDDVLKKDPSLNVTIDGPSKVELSCTDDSIGYTFWYVPTIIGTYYISISYSNKHHIEGSPFKVSISP